MVIFAPVYVLGDSQRSHLDRQRQRERKRRRVPIDDDDAASDEEEQKRWPETSSQPTSASYPVHKKDPYHVAGHARQDDLPAPPFPHAPLHTPQPIQHSIDEELAQLQPPLYVPGPSPRSQSTSLKRLHTTNLTALLHRCMLKGDWDRASRAWGLLLRTEVFGEGPAVRRHGHWTLAAELLMRRTYVDSAEQINDKTNARTATISEKGFKLAREFYERLILQFPHTPRSHHAVNALSIYPAMFNVWIFGLQDRSRQARQQLEPERPGSSCSDKSTRSVRSTEPMERLVVVRKTELRGARDVASRMDEVMSGPPYDTSISLLILRGMVSLWLADLIEEVTTLSSADDSLDVDDPSELVREERTKARQIITQVRSAGHGLTASLNAFIDDGERSLATDISG